MDGLSEKDIIEMSCVLCNSDNNNKIYSNLIKCSDCGFVWADVDVTKAKVKEIYRDSYFFGEEYADYIKEEKALRKTFERNISFISKIRPSGKLLDIGCAYGYFLDVAKEKYDVKGVEINKAACEFARSNFKVNAICGDFLELEFEENYFDVVTMFSAIEHLKSPHLYVEKISKLMKSGGIFICATPNIDSFISKFRKKKWRQIHPPTHLSYFSVKSLTRLFENNRLQVLKWRHLGEYRSVYGMMYIILKIKNRLSWLFSILERLKLLNGVLYINTFDQMYVIASKEITK